MEKSIKPVTYFIYALLTFAALGADFLAEYFVFLFNNLNNERASIWQAHWYGIIIPWLITILLLGTCAFIFIKWAKKRKVFAELINFKWSNRVMLLIIIGVILSIVSAITNKMVFDEPIPQLLQQYRSYNNMFGNNALIVTVFQTIYYIFESILLVIIIVFFQKAGEIWFKIDKFPWGSVGLILTWGGIHFLSHQEGAIFISIWSAVPGILYLLGKRNFYPVYITLLLLFII